MVRLQVDEDLIEESHVLKGKTDRGSKWKRFNWEGRRELSPNNKGKIFNLPSPLVEDSSSVTVTHRLGQGLGMK